MAGKAREASLAPGKAAASRRTPRWRLRVEDWCECGGANCGQRQGQRGWSRGFGLACVRFGVLVSGEWVDQGRVAMAGKAREASLAPCKAAASRRTPRWRLGAEDWCECGGANCGQRRGQRGWSRGFGLACVRFGVLASGEWVDQGSVAVAGKAREASLASGKAAASRRTPRWRLGVEDWCECGGANCGQRRGQRRRRHRPCAVVALGGNMGCYGMRIRHGVRHNL